MSTMKIYHGKTEPLTAVGKHQVRLLQWLEYRYHNGGKELDCIVVRQEH
jgi:hypothetical protein